MCKDYIIGVTMNYKMLERIGIKLDNCSVWQ